MYITKKIKIPAAGRNEDYKFKNTNSSTSSSSSSSIGLPQWLQFVDYDEESESIKFKKHLLSEGEIAAFQQGTFNTNIFDNLPQGSKTNKGILQVGTGINVVNGIISLDSSAVTPQTLSFSNNSLSISNGNSVDLSTLQTDLSAYYNKTQTDTLLSGKANTSHTHSISNVTNLQSSLDAKANKNGSSSENFTVKDLTIHGTVNHWLADVITVDDAKLQLNRKQGSATVASGLDIYNGTSVVSSLNYTTAGNWQFTSGEIYQGGTKVALQNVSINAGNGLTGGGAISANRTITLGTPSTITATSTNSVDSASHTHAISLSKSDIGLGNVGNYSDYARKTISESVSGSWSFSGLPTINRQGEDVQLLRFNTERQWHFRQVRSGATAGLALVSEVDSKSFQIGYFDGTVAANFFVGSSSSTVSLVPGGNGNVSIGVNTSISGKLDIRPNTNAWGNYLNIISATDATKYTSIINDAAGLKLRNFGGGHTYFRSSANNSTLFFINDSTGNVAIGGENANEKLRVVGNIAADGNIVAGSTSKTTDTVVRVLAGDSKAAGFEAYGASRGTGYLFVGQSTTHGGGIEYNGDNNPVTTGAGANYITLYRRTNGVDYWTARNRHNNNNWEFRGNITAQGEVTAYSSSDKRLKSNITPLTSSLSIIDKINPVSFNWNDKAVELNNTKNTLSKNYGVIAQELEEVLPDLVHTTNGYKSVDYIQLIGVLLSAVKELHNEIKELKNR